MKGARTLLAAFASGLVSAASAMSKEVSFALKGTPNASMPACISFSDMEPTTHYTYTLEMQLNVYINPK